MEERLQKIIARAGVASRRHAEQLILSGQVTLNGRVVAELGTKADAERDHIKVAGKLLRAPESKTYVALHKPSEVVSTMSDPEGRRSLADFLHGVPGRVFPVGRLEYHASGLLLLTSDGDLADRILRAHALPQTYCVKVKGGLGEAETRQLAEKSGVRLRRLQGAPNPWYEVTMSKAREDRLRSELARLGHPVEKIRRIKIGNIELDSLPPGRYRLLNQEEVAGLGRAVDRALAPALRRGAGQEQTDSPQRIGRANRGAAPAPNRAKRSPRRIARGMRTE